MGAPVRRACNSQCRRAPRPVPAAGWQTGLGMVHADEWEIRDASFKVTVGAPAGMECMSKGQLEILAKTEGSLG